MKRKIANKNVLGEFTARHYDTINAVNKWFEIIENNDLHHHIELRYFFQVRIM